MNRISGDQEPQMQRRNDSWSGRQPSDDVIEPNGLAGAVARLSDAAWLLLGGFVLAIASIFLTWETTTATVSAVDMPPFTDTKIIVLNVGAKFVLIVAICTVIWLAWPVFVRSAASIKRLAGLSAVAGLLVLFSVGWFISVAGDNANGVNASVGFGFVSYTVAAVTIAVGVEIAWVDRSTTQEQASSAGLRRPSVGREHDRPLS
jgi:hypothetical protein